MRKIVQVLFLVFYFASSYAISQEHVRLVVSELQDSASRNAEVQIDSCSNLIAYGFPAFRQAKPKTACDTYFGPRELIHFLPHQSEWTFHTCTSSLKSLASIERLLSRAPPAIS
jgi:hypothetical protein